ncbi:STAS domain-containing protein [Nonomuraea sp. NN258]|uniref:STAS domain-containing protein n=1 Tax=Nonomuraea antri TaxID=2730852 RepID=UPI0015695AE1|nr:STAS domain-containing protein [Nonomuraea antri]NRQ34523.1 STAS domain-containing protein [Nonomuraea antri]
MTPLALTHQHLPGVTVVTVAGELDTTNHDQLPAFVAQARQRPADQVVLDLARLRFMDGNGLRAVLACRTETVRGGAELRVAAPHPSPARLLKITGLDARLSLHATLEQALFAATVAARPAT